MSTNATTKKVMVSMKGSPSHYCTLIGEFLAEGHEVKVFGMEGAVVIAVDAVNRAVREGMGVVREVHTKSIPIKSRTTGRVNQRSQIEITVRHEAEITQLEYT